MANLVLNVGPVGATVWRTPPQGLAQVSFTKLSMNVLVSVGWLGLVQDALRSRAKGERSSARLPPAPAASPGPGSAALPPAAGGSGGARLKGHALLEPCQRRANAVVDAPPESKMVGSGAAHVQPVRFGKGLQVAVGCSQEADHPLSWGYPLPTQLNRLAGYPVVHLNRAVITQKFVNRTVQQRAGSSRSLWSWCGLRSGARVPFPMRVRVVSFPTTNTSSRFTSRSSRSSRSPPDSPFKAGAYPARATISVTIPRLLGH